MKGLTIIRLALPSALRWSSAADVKRSYATASIVSADRIVFNIKGNGYRLVVAVDFEKIIIWISRPRRTR